MTATRGRRKRHGKARGTSASAVRDHWKTALIRKNSQQPGRFRPPSTQPAERRLTEIPYKPKEALSQLDERSSD